MAKFLIWVRFDLFTIIFLSSPLYGDYSVFNSNYISYIVLILTKKTT